MTHTYRPVAAALVLAAVAVPTLAEGPPVDTSFLKRYAETRGFMLGRPTKPKFTPDGKAVLFLRAAGPTTPRLSLFEFDVATGQTKELLSPDMLQKGGDEKLSEEEKARRERQRVSTGGFADYQLDESGNRVLVMLSGRPWVFDRATGKARELNAGKGAIIDPKWSPDGKYVSYVRDHDVMAYDLAADKELPVTTGGTAEKTNGLAEFVAQEEMGRHTGYWWSPDSKHIAYEEADHAGVEVWHIADPFKPGSAPQKQFYPRPGKKNVSVRLGIKPVAGGDTVWVEWPKPEQANILHIQGETPNNEMKRLASTFEYLGRVVWLGSRLLLVVQSRDQRDLGFFLVDPLTGKRSAGERGYTHAGWLNLPADPKRLENDDTVMVSEHVNNSCLHVPIGPLEAFGPEAHSLIEVSADYDRIYYLYQPDTTQQHVYSISRKDYNAPPQQYTTKAGIHTAAVPKKTDAMVLTSTTVNSLPVSSVVLGSKAVGTLPSVAEEPPFTPNVSVEQVRGYWTAVVRPRNFDPKKKYPVIVDVYGGPHHLHVVQAMRNWLIPQWLADQGFVVVAIDNRGTPGRDREWERAIYQRLGTVPLEDQVNGLDALCDKFPELDRDRVGMVGWSFGGYMSANAVLRRPDVFKAAVAGAPVTDWEDYDTHYTERYMGLLPESRKAYDESSLLPLAKNLSRPLLLVHGTADDNVYYRHSLRLADALFRAGREFEMLPLPGMTHAYSADPLVAERLWERAATFFRRHLGEPK